MGLLACNWFSAETQPKAVKHLLKCRVQSTDTEGKKEDRDKKRQKTAAVGTKIKFRDHQDNFLCTSLYALLLLLLFLLVMI